MKHIKIAAGLAHVNYGRIADLVKEVSDAGVDYIHSDAADMHDLQNMKLMGGHQIIAGIRPETDKPIECHIYTVSMDRMFIEQIDEAGADMLIILRSTLSAHNWLISSTGAVNATSRLV